MASFEVGARVETEKNGKGRVAFVGETKFAEGEWIGVVLDEPNGKNNGTVKEVAYFSCEPNHGLFIRAGQLKLESGGSRMKAPGLKAPASMRKDSSTHGSSSRLSTTSSPKMTPASSMEKISRSTAPSLAKKASTSGLEPYLKKRRSGVSVKPSPKGSNSSSSSSTTSSGVPAAAAAARASATPAKRPPTLPPASAPTPTSPPRQASEDRVEDEETIPLARQDSVKARVLKMEQTPLSAPSPTFIPTGMDQATENEYLRLESKDLKEKLETLRMKRKEDREIIVEYERNKVQLQALIEYKNKATEAHSQLQRQLQEKSREVDGLLEWKQQKQEEIMNAEQAIEMATLDKEVAEEKSEQLEMKVEDLETRVQELEADLAILREEMEHAGAPAAAGGQGVPQGNSVQMKQMQQQNERMKEALIRIRDMNGEAIAEKNAAKEECERMKAESSELLRMGEIWKKKAEEAEQAIVSLKEQVDAYMGSESLIQHLSDKSLDMEEKLKVLEQEKEDLEALRDMDEQIAEEQREVEKGLRKEIEGHLVTINELLLRQRQDEAHADQLSQTIIKFRKKTGELNSEIEELKDKVLMLEEALKEEKEEEKSAAGQASLALVNAARTFADIVDGRTKSIELEYAQKLIKYMRAFLPDNFTKPGGDQDCIYVNVIIPRLAEKAELLANLTKDKYPSVPGGMRAEHVTKSHKAEQWAHLGKLSHTAAGIKATCSQIESALRTTTGDRLAAVANLQSDLSLQERSLDNYLDLLKQGRLDENTSLEQLESTGRYLVRNVLDEHLGGRDSFDVSAWLTLLLSQMIATISWWRTNEQRLGFLITNSSGSDVVSWATKVGQEMRTCEQLILRTRNRLATSGEKKLAGVVAGGATTGGGVDGHGGGGVQLTDDLHEDITRASYLLGRLAHLLHETCALAAVQMAMLADVNDFESDRVKEMLESVVEKMYGKVSLDKVFTPIDKEVSALSAHVASMQRAIEEGRHETDANNNKNTFPPLLDRAHGRKQAASEAEGLRWQVEKRDNEIIELKKNIKARIDDISNYKLRLEMAESRMEKFGQIDQEKEKHLQDKINQLTSDLKKQRIEFDEAMDGLQSQLLERERENKELSERAKNMSKKALLQGIQSIDHRSLASPTSPMAPSTIGGGGGGSTRSLASGGGAEVALLESQLNTAMEGMKRLTLEARSAQAEQRMAAVRVPPMVSGPFSLASKPNADQRLDVIIKEAEHLQREESRFAFFAPSSSSISWAKIEEERREWQKARDHFHFRINALRARLHRLWAEEHPGEEVPKLLGIQQRKKIIPHSELNMNSKTFKDICAKWAIPI